MNLRELKSSLAKLPSSMDEATVIIQTGFNGETQYDSLSFVGKFEDERIEECAVLGTLEATRVLVKEKKLRVPDDYVPGGDDDGI